MNKILMYSLFYYPHPPGGAEIAIKEITDRLPGGKFEFHMLTLRLDPAIPKTEKIGNVLVHRVGLSGRGERSTRPSFIMKIGKITFLIFSLLKAVSLQRKEKFNTVWAMMAGYAGLGALFFKLIYPKVKMTLSLQEGDPIDEIKHRARFIYPVWKMIFKKADAVQAISSYLADFGKSIGKREDVVVVPNGVNPETFLCRNKEKFRKELRGKFGWSMDDFILVTTSRLVEKNAVEDIINSLSFLPKEVKLLIIGIGPLEVKLKDEVRELALENRVLFLGYVNHTDLPPYLWGSDVFVRPSLSEGMGNSFIEAMAAGLPVIGTAIGGIPDFLKDKETGLICAIRDPKDIARKVTVFMRDREIRDYVVQNAYKLVSEKYDWSLIAQKMARVLTFMHMM